MTDEYEYAPGRFTSRQKLTDEEIVELMDSAIFEASSHLHENMPGLASAIFAAIRAYEKATRLRL